MSSLQSSRVLFVDSRRIRRLIIIAGCSLLPALVSGVSAQTLPSRNVARLISTTSDEVRSSRSRRVNVPVIDPRRSEIVTDDAIPSLHGATKTERQAFEATNEMRAKNGFTSLSWDSELSHMARTHSEMMARLGFFAHETPEGLRLRDRARAARIRFQVIGENIAYNQGVDDPGTFAVQRWMISSGHRANILSREFRASGVGSFTARDGRVYITQIFIAR